MSESENYRMFLNEDRYAWFVSRRELVVDLARRPAAPMGRPRGSRSSIGQAGRAGGCRVPSRSPH